MIFSHIFKVLVTCAILFACIPVQANLLISPTRVAFDARDRTQSINLINTSNTHKTYRLEWTQMRMNEVGNYQSVPEEEYSTFPIASPYLRFTPRQVTLAPGERQTVKLMARRSKEMTDVEYRSHLNFIVLPNDEFSGDEKQGVNLKLNLLLSYSIPIILRTDNHNAQINIKDIKVNQKQSKSFKDVLITLSREGSTSVTGNINAFFVPENSTEELHVGTLNGVNFFPDTQTLTKPLIRVNHDIEITEGILKVEYEGSKEFSGKMLATKKVRLVN